MRRTWRVAALALAMVAALAGCGGRDSQESAEENCLILVNGNKLCGDDARSYCEAFIRTDGGLRDVITCRRIGVVMPKTSGELELDREAAESREPIFLRPKVVRAFGGAVDESFIRVAKQPGGGLLVRFAGSLTDALAQRICEAARHASPTLGVIRVANDDGRALEFGDDCSAGRPSG